MPGVLGVGEAVTRLLTIDEAAAHLGIHPRTLRQLMADGTISGITGPTPVSVNLNLTCTSLATIACARNSSRS